MNTLVKKAIRDEDGKILILVLVLLVVGGLVLAPLLGLMSTGLASGQVYEKKASELYAADAGVEDAIWRITDPGRITFDEEGNYSYPEEGVADLWMVNEKSVDVTIHRDKMPKSTPCREVYSYRILSTASGTDGSTTKVEAFLESVGLNYTEFSGSAITSGGDVTILGTKAQIVGDILLAPEGELKWKDDEGAFEGGKVKRENLDWPDPDDFEAFYLADVKNGATYSGDTVIDLEGQDLELGSVYVKEGKLTITNSINVGARLTLTGTVYAENNISIDGSGDKGILYLDLNEQTIFSASIDGVENSKWAISIGSKCSIEGPGALIAVGGIDFRPNIEIGMTEPVLVMSLSAEVNSQPTGNFHGAIVGARKVNLQPNATVVYPEGGFGSINFPGFIEGKEIYTIESWEIK